MLAALAQLVQEDATAANEGFGVGFWLGVVFLAILVVIAYQLWKLLKRIHLRLGMVALAMGIGASPFRMMASHASPETKFLFDWGAFDPISAICATTAAVVLFMTDRMKERQDFELDKLDKKQQHRVALAEHEAAAIQRRQEERNKYAKMYDIYSRYMLSETTVSGLSEEFGVEEEDITHIYAIAVLFDQQLQAGKCRPLARLGRLRLSQATSNRRSSRSCRVSPLDLRLSSK